MFNIEANNSWLSGISEERGLVIVRRGFFIGRFQPFHLGHLKAVEYILGREDEVIIGIGSAQYSHTFENPLTAGERIECIQRTLKASGIGLDRCFIVPVPDIGEHRLWVSRVESFCPSFQTVYSNNGLVKVLFEERGYRVEPVPFFNREKYVATEIRHIIASGGEWKHLVHEAAYEYLIGIGIERRLRGIMQSDKT